MESNINFLKLNRRCEFLDHLDEKGLKSNDGLQVVA